MSPEPLNLEFSFHKDLWPDVLLPPGVALAFDEDMDQLLRIAAKAV